MPRLREGTVRDAALQWLHAHYAQREGITRVADPWREAVVERPTTQYRGRADGLLVAQRADDSLVVVALEAKSSRTIAAVRPNDDFDFAAISQVQRYPADERWVAVSADVFNRLRWGSDEYLRNQCLQRGIGLLVVISSRRVREEVRAAAIGDAVQREDWLGWYMRAAELREALRLQAVERCTATLL